MANIYYYIGAVLLAGGLLWLAWQRPNRRRLAWRSLAIVGAVIALLFVARPPQRTIRQNTTQAILLTPGYYPDSLKVLRRKVGRNQSIFRYAQVIGPGLQINSLKEIRTNHPQVRQLHVLGYGLTADELAEADSVQLITHLNAPPAGVTEVNWPNEMLLGENITVTGQYYQATAKTTQLFLSLAGKRQDSITLNKAGYNRFLLRYLPKQTGEWVLTLEEKEKSKPTTYAGPVPVVVAPRPSIKVLLLQASPGFEFKFLKNYLAAAGHAVAVRTTISKNVYQTEWLNFNRQNLSVLSSALLNQFDLIVTDSDALQHLTVTEQNNLVRAIRTNGLGLLALPATWPMPSNPPLLAAFRFKPAPNAKTNVAAIYWPERQKTASGLTAPATINFNPTLKNLVWHTQGTLLAAQKQGWGTVAFSLLPETFSWRLAGDSATYNQYWAFVLSQLTKPLLANHTWHTTATPHSYVNQQLTLHLAEYTGNLAKPDFPEALVRTTQADSTSVYLAQHPVLPHRFTGTYWPRQAGWHQVQKPGGTPHAFYVFPATAWTSQQQHIRLNQTKSWIKEAATNKKEPLQYYYKQEPWPQIYFFIFFLVCAGFLWLEEKL